MFGLAIISMPVRHADRDFHSDRYNQSAIGATADSGTRPGHSATKPLAVGAMACVAGTDLRRCPDPPSTKECPSLCLCAVAAAGSSDLRCISVGLPRRRAHSAPPPPHARAAPAFFPHLVRLPPLLS